MQKIVMSIIIVFAFQSCSQDSPVNHTDTSGITISGNGVTVKFEDFGFFTSAVQPGSTMLIIHGTNQSDTLLIMTTFELVRDKVDESLAIQAPSLLFISSSVHSGDFIVLNAMPLEVPENALASGSLTFTTLDIDKTVAGIFANGSSLVGLNTLDSGTFKASISGEFVASRELLLLKRGFDSKIRRLLITMEINHENPNQ